MCGIVNFKKQHSATIIRPRYRCAVYIFYKYMYNNIGLLLFKWPTCHRIPCLLRNDPAAFILKLCHFIVGAIKMIYRKCPAWDSSPHQHNARLERDSRLECRIGYRIAYAIESYICGDTQFGRASLSPVDYLLRRLQNKPSTRALHLAGCHGNRKQRTCAQFVCEQSAP